MCREGGSLVAPHKLMAGNRVAKTAIFVAQAISVFLLTA
jgi:hypothetical protein